MKTRNAARIAVAAAVALAAGTASAQNITGQVVGRVLDADTGKPIAGAVVTATSPAWIPQTATTSASGYYVLPLLPPARYAVAVKAAGYGESLPRDVTVAIDWRIRNDVRLLAAKAGGDASPPRLAQNR